MRVGEGDLKGEGHRICETGNGREMRSRKRGGSVDGQRVYENNICVKMQ